MPVYIAEIAPVELRGGLGALNQLAITVGMLLVYLLGIGLGWRTLAIVGTPLLPPPPLLPTEKDDFLLLPPPQASSPLCCCSSGSSSSPRAPAGWP